MKLSCKIEVSNNLSKLFEDFDSSALGEAWEIYLSLEGNAIDDWIVENSNTIQTWYFSNKSSKDKSITKDEMRKIVHFVIQDYALQKGLAIYLQDPGRRRLKDEIFMTLATMGFTKEALDFCMQQFSNFVNLQITD